MGAAAACHNGSSIEADECATLRVRQWTYCQCHVWWSQKYLDKFTNAGMGGCPVRVVQLRFTPQLEELELSAAHMQHCKLLCQPDCAGGTQLRLARDNVMKSDARGSTHHVVSS